MLKAVYIPYTLQFKHTIRTSRGEMSVKPTYFVKLTDTDCPGICGIGECALFKGLSAEDHSDYESRLQSYCSDFNNLDINEIAESSIRFGFETALSDLQNGGIRQPFCTGDLNPIRINGLIWMADGETMQREADGKTMSGFKCVKLKIGGINFERELAILRSLRNRYDEHELEIRLDANGGFTPENVHDRLLRLSEFKIHSIEQPIKAGQWDEMRKICEKSPIPIALDEELIGITPDPIKTEMLRTINPRYIVLKPSLCGGFSEADRWIKTAETLNIGWWATSALESDIGLNAIARWVSNKKIVLPQGLGTGLLYVNNVTSPLRVIGDSIISDSNKQWNLTSLKF